MMKSESVEHLNDRNHAQAAAGVGGSGYTQDGYPYAPDEVEYTEYTDKDFLDEEYGYASEKPPKFYKTKRFWIRCGIITVILLAIFIPLLIYVILPKLVQHIVDGSTMSMSQLNMTDATETNVKVSIAGSVNNAGIFPATIEFPEPIIVSWEGKQLGSMIMSSVKASGGKGAIADSTMFNIIDKEAFTTFSKQMLVIEDFTWVLTSKVNVKAMGMSIKDIKLTKDLKMLGMNNFGKVTIESFDMPGDAPNNTGAYVRLITSMNNPSPIGMQLGTMVLDLFYEGIHLGEVSCKNAVLIGNSPSPLALEGILKRQTNQTALDTVSTLMSNYLAGNVSMTQAKGQSVKPDGVNAVSWLSNALLALTLNVPLKSPTPLSIIQDIKINDMGMVFSPSSPFSPISSSNSVQAGFKLPFNITVAMQNVTNTMSIVYKNKVLGDIATAGWAPATSDLNKGLINFGLPATPLVVKDDAHNEFSDFVADLTVKDQQTFSVQGMANAISSTPMGVIKLTGVPFKSDVTLKGLNFNAINVEVSDVVVIGGTSDSIVMRTKVNMPNSSSLSVTAGQVVLTINDQVSGEYLGELVIPNLKVVPGNNPTPTQFVFHPRSAALRDQFLADYIVGATFKLKVFGSLASTDVPELKEAMSLVSISSPAPGLTPKVRLITSGWATAGVGTLLGNRQSQTGVKLINPMETPFFIDTMTTEVYWQGSHFGTINQKIDLTVPAKGSADTPSLILQSPTGADFGVFLISKFVPAYPTLAFGGAPVPFDLDSTITIKVGGPNGYPATMRYRQEQDIMTKMKII